MRSREAKRSQPIPHRPALAGKRFVIIASELHSSIGRSLVKGATEVLRRAGVREAQIRLVWVPGAFELPTVASALARSRRPPHAMIALGALIRGETVQYALIAQTVAQGLSQVALMSGIPVGFGVVVASTLAQARMRAGLAPSPGKGRSAGNIENRGAEAARASLEVLTFLLSLKER